METGVCRTDPKLSPDDFILAKGRSSRRGKEACARCDHNEVCYEYGVRTNSVGIWGGRVLAIHPEAAPVEIEVIIRLDDHRPQRIAPSGGTGFKADPNSYPAPMAARSHLG